MTRDVIGGIDCMHRQTHEQTSLVEPSVAGWTDEATRREEAGCCYPIHDYSRAGDGVNSKVLRCLRWIGAYVLC